MENNTKVLASDDATLSFSASLLMTMIYCILEVFGIGGNILVILVISNGRLFLTNYYYLVFHLALCDIFLLLAGNMLFTVAHWLHPANQPTALTTFVCKVWYPLCESIFFCEIGFMIVIAVLRHRAITRPLRPQLSRKMLSRTILTVYTITLLFGIPNFLSLQYNTASGCVDIWLKVNTYYRLYYWVRQLATSVIPLAFLTILYTKMCRFLFVHQRSLRQLFSSHAQNANSVYNRVNSSTSLLKARAAKNTRIVLVSILIVVQYFASVLPVRIMSLPIGYTDHKERSIHATWGMALYFLGTCTLNPLVYGLMDKTLHAGYIKCLKMTVLWCKKK